MSDAKRDANRVPTLIGVSSSDGTTPTLVEVITSTGRMKVDATIGDQRYYEYMGKQTIDTYTYYGFKERGTAEWKIMRKDDNDASAWAYAYSEDSSNNWSTAWAAPDSESYGDPPDS